MAGNFSTAKAVVFFFGLDKSFSLTFIESFSPKSVVCVYLIGVEMANLLDQKKNWPTF